MYTRGGSHGSADDWDRDIGADIGGAATKALKRAGLESEKVDVQKRRVEQINKHKMRGGVWYSCGPDA